MKETPVKIPAHHAPIVVDGVSYDLTHLDASVVAMDGKGRKSSTDLNVLVKFSNHVCTERSKRGDPCHVLDQYGTKRFFDNRRYQMSQRLPALICDALTNDKLCFISKSYGGIENLMLIELENGDTWSVVFCFQPLAEGVVMEVLSTHPRVIREEQKSRRPLSFFARKSLFEQDRVPKNLRPGRSRA